MTTEPILVKAIRHPKNVVATSSLVFGLVTLLLSLLHMATEAGVLLMPSVIAGIMAISSALIGGCVAISPRLAFRGLGTAVAGGAIALGCVGLAIPAT